MLTNPVSRRQFMKGAGALVVSFRFFGGSSRLLAQSESFFANDPEATALDSWLAIAPDGSVTETSLRHSTMKAPRVEGCVLHEIASWHFVATPEGIHVLSFPFTFEPESRP